ncbi:AMP-binding protein [Janibacter sp. YIM B02568]|uniref:class I adenylate-forming enzyme family protein n=1 Tax=Janibacter endophyticus TaxID=2806261 RepID=UPI00195146FE|nr:AMP-binding protein [Janibacter endophyticus]MBM6545412.1 AMP-binding protein [Janibacter endophyticus]
MIDVTSLYGRRNDDRWNRMVIGDVFERVRWSTPDKVALIGWSGAYGRERLHQVTYAQADDFANRVANALLAQGLERGSRVLLYCDNSIEAVLTMIGVAKAGLVAVPVNPNFTGDLLAWVQQHVEPAFVVADAEFSELAQDALGSSPGVGAVIEIGLGGSVPGGIPGWWDWVHGYPDSEPDVEIPLHADDIWCLTFTSGTTAMPKASMSSHTFSYLSAWSYAMSLTRGLDVETDLVMTTFLPIIFHTGFSSNILPPLLTGGTLVLGRRPDASQLAHAISETRATAVWAGSPLWVQALVDSALAGPPKTDLSSLTVVMFAWGTINPRMQDDIRGICGEHVRLLEVFGQTESMTCYRFWPHREPEKFVESMRGVNHVGRPTPLLAAQIVGPDGGTLVGTVGVPGEAVYRSPAITSGYYRDEEATQEALRGGWLHSGDSCEYTSDGSQIMVDRYKDIVKSGGENVSSLRVETVLVECPGVSRVAVVGLPDEKWGERVTAAVTLHPGALVTEEEIITFAKDRLAGFEVPKQVVIMTELPQTVGGKIQKHRVREHLAR